MKAGLYLRQKIDFVKKLEDLPIFLLLAVVSTCCFGFLILYSASNNLQPWLYKQIINFCIFFPCAIILAFIDLKTIFNLSYFFYFVTLLLLIGVEAFGTSAMGAKRWIDFGLLKIQPSELIKPALVLMIARYCHRLQAYEIDKLSKLLPLLFAIFLPVILVIKQPDLGTGMIILIVAAIMLFAAGVSIKKFIITGMGIIGFLPVVWTLMHEYQKKRVLIFFDPGRDPLGAGYNIIQSKIAVGSGGLLGKGLTQGTQSGLDFLPEHQTDFIFATLAEELGFAGAAVLLILYGIITFFSLSIVFNCKTIFARMLVLGITATFFCHIFVNISMVIGILPVVGVPLPFISYGGTMMASMLLGFGLVMNAHMHQRNF